MAELTNATARGVKPDRRQPGGRRNPFATWSRRFLVALVLGASFGAGGGVLTVRRLEPGRGTGVDSLAVMLDSLARAKAGADTGADRAAGAAAGDVADDALPAPPVALVTVPTLEGLEEGAARNALLDAGLEVGEVQFQASSLPAGTVLASIPVAGAQVPSQTRVVLVLSDGRADDPDTLSRPSSSYTP